MTSARLDKMRLALRCGVLVLAVLSSLDTPHVRKTLRFAPPAASAGLIINELVSNGTNR